MKTMMSGRRNQNAPTNSQTRRQVIAGVAMTFGGLALGLTKLRAATGEEISRTAESIHQETVFKASRKRVYEALTDAKQFNEVTKIVAAKEPAISLEKSPTVIGPDVGGAFSLFGGIILGRHVELVPETRIVQAWRVAYWAPGIYSIVKFELVEQGTGTKIVFDHTGFPKGDAETLATGWKAHYWEPLAKFLA
ncbi:MAG TPA: SRPBCC domain-containing protein [Chthoniobacterales bacterium]|jgi:activator of HSP90 ATPase|nr:SRPBCC domain-containing protein [Chthoniobacterales bacterium]